MIKFLIFPIILITLYATDNLNKDSLIITALVFTGLFHLSEWLLKGKDDLLQTNNKTINIAIFVILIFSMVAAGYYVQF